MTEYSTRLLCAVRGGTDANENASKLVNGLFRLKRNGCGLPKKFHKSGLFSIIKSCDGIVGEGSSPAIVGRNACAEMMASKSRPLGETEDFDRVWGWAR